MSVTPQVITSCQLRVLMQLAFIPESWFAVSGPCWCCLFPQGHINHTITCTVRLGLGAQMLLSCRSVYTTWFWCPHVSFSIWVHHKPAHRCSYLSDKIRFLHSTSGQKSTLYFSLCMHNVLSVNMKTYEVTCKGSRCSFASIAAFSSC